MEQADNYDAARVMSYADAAARGADSIAAATAMRNRIERQKGGVADFRHRLGLQQLHHDAVDALDEFYQVLRSGILPDELVPIEDFIAALGSKNADQAFQQAIGPYRYFCLALRARDHGTIGAAGFVTFCHQHGPATMHASYYAVLPCFRRLGLGRLLLTAAAETAIGFVASTRPEAFDAGPMVQFIEANDIAHMTLRERLLDEAIGMHPLARDALWEHIGFREIVDIAYRQRHDPPIELALKAVLVETDRDATGPRLRGLRPPLEISGDLMLRHVTAFDGLLMNYENARRTLIALHRPLPHPVGNGLLAHIDAAATLPVKSLDQAAHDRQEWQVADELLRTRSNLSLDTTMQALRDALASPSHAPPDQGRPPHSGSAPRSTFSNSGGKA